MDAVTAAEVGLAAIGTGDLAYAEDLAEQRGIDFPLLVDDERRTYEVVGTRRSRAIDMLKPSVVAGTARALAGGSLQGKPGPAPMILGAAHVIEPDGSVPYAWINDDIADNAPIEDILAEVRT